MSFDRKRLIQFWLSVENTYPTLSTAALKVLLPFTTSYMCEIGFSAMIGIKTKLRNKLQISNNLRLKLTHISVDVEEVISQNRNKPIKCIASRWVAKTYRSPKWVAAQKSLRTTVLICTPCLHTQGTYRRNSLSQEDLVQLTMAVNSLRGQLTGRYAFNL
ncbi:Protein ZBED8 [Trichinella spiralis]|uniref:Protein ZBED8 n=1 Tax=Trichinella spiralis TaxID=6334 RepID=A0A0V1BQ82_TRISP|nr:Protein ZBED8 [Trichinella spiralis]